MKPRGRRLGGEKGAWILSRSATPDSTLFSRGSRTVSWLRKHKLSSDLPPPFSTGMAMAAGFSSAAKVAAVLAYDGKSAYDLDQRIDAALSHDDPPLLSELIFFRLALAGRPPLSLPASALIDQIIVSTTSLCHFIVADYALSRGIVTNRQVAPSRSGTRLAGVGLSLFERMARFGGRELGELETTRDFV